MRYCQKLQYFFWYTTYVGDGHQSTTKVFFSYPHICTAQAQSTHEYLGLEELCCIMNLVVGSIASECQPHFGWVVAVVALSVGSQQTTPQTEY